MAPTVRLTLQIVGFDPHRRAALQRRARLVDQRVVERLLQPVILRLANETCVSPATGVGLWNSLREVEAIGLPVLDRLVAVEHLHLADHLVEAAIAQLGHLFAHFLGDEEEDN